MKKAAVLGAGYMGSAITFPLSDNPEIAVAEMVDVRVLLAALETGLIKGPDSEQKTPRQLEFQLASA